VFRCLTCAITHDACLCYGCAKRCHEGHDVDFVRIASRAFCDCAALSECLLCGPEAAGHTRDVSAEQRLLDSALCGSPKSSKSTKQLASATCSLYRFGTEPIQQDLFHCYTCGLLDKLVCCQECADTCHKGHDVRYFDHCAGYCDCGAGCAALPCRCLTSKPSSFSRSAVISRGVSVHCGEALSDQPPVPSSPNRTSAAQQQCIVCLDFRQDCVFVPCGHMCMCFDCAVKYADDKKQTYREQHLHDGLGNTVAESCCPICRARSTAVIRVFQT
jgi:hypothetical protein